MGTLQEIINGFADKFRHPGGLGAVRPSGQAQEAELAQHVHGEGDGNFLKIAP
jgi:hypothetical protein